MTITIPERPDQLEELLNDSRKVAELIKDGRFGTAMKAYAESFAATADGDEAKAQLNEQIQIGVAEFLKQNDQRADGVTARMQEGRPRIFGLEGLTGDASWQARKNALYNRHAPGAKADGTFSRLADYMQALSLASGGNLPARPGCTPQGELRSALAKLSEIQNSFSTDTPSDGGFLIPEEYRSDLLMLELEASIMLPRMTTIPMGSQRLSIPAVDSTSNVSSVFGGITVSWTDEATQPTESSAKFEMVTLDAKKLMAYCTAPNELVADATAFGAFLDQALPKAMAFEADYRCMQGTGAGEPLGFLNGGAVITASADSGQGASTITLSNLANIFCRMLPSSLMNAIWIADIGAFPQLSQMTVPGALGNTTPVWMNNGVIGAPPAMIYGRPVYFTEKCPSLGNAGDINFLDPSFMLFGDRQQVTTAASQHFAFNVDKTAYRITQRADARPWIQSAITPKNNGNTLSPFVNLSGTRT